MDENESARKFVAKWDESVVVDVYRDGDYRLIVQESGAFQVLTDTTLACFFRRAPNSIRRQNPMNATVTLPLETLDAVVT